MNLLVPNAVTVRYSTVFNVRLFHLITLNQTLINEQLNVFNLRKYNNYLNVPFYFMVY